MRRLLPTCLTPLFLVLAIEPAFATADINFSEFGSKLGEALGIGVFGGGLLATLIVSFAVMGLTSAILRRKPSMMELLFVMFPLYGLCVYLVWLPVWCFVVVVFIIALMYSKKIVGVFQ